MVTRASGFTYFTTVLTIQSLEMVTFCHISACPAGIWNENSKDQEEDDMGRFDLWSICITGQEDQYFSNVQ